MNATILLVDDDHAAREALAQTLQQAGYRLHTAASGSEACTLLAANIIDILITEVQLPDIEEQTLLAIVRQKQPAPSLIIQTARGTLQSAVAALDARACAYLLKPYAPALLLERIAEELRERQQQARQQQALVTIGAELQLLTAAHTLHAHQSADLTEPVAPSQNELRVGQLTIEYRSHKVLFEHTTLALTTTQYKLLCCLAERPGQPISGAEIVSRTHDIQLSNEEAQLLLKPHVRNLRRKIPAGYLLNVRGYGYQLVAPSATPI